MAAWDCLPAMGRAGTHRGFNLPLFRTCLSAWELTTGWRKTGWTGFCVISLTLSILTAPFWFRLTRNGTTVIS